MWLCNRQGFLEKYYLKGGDFFKNPSGLTLQRLHKSHSIFAKFSFITVVMMEWDRNEY
jgi:hypothetical protein